MMQVRTGMPPGTFSEQGGKKMQRKRVCVVVMIAGSGQNLTHRQSKGLRSPLSSLTRGTGFD